MAVYGGVDFIDFDSQLNDEEKLARQTARQFVESEVIPIIEKHSWPFERQSGPTVQTGIAQQQVDQLRARIDDLARQNDELRRQLANTLAIAPLSPKIGSPKKYATASIEELLSRCVARTPLQCDSLLTDVKGDWLKASGIFISSSTDAQVFVSLPDHPEIPVVMCRFDPAVWNERLRIFRTDDKIQLEGQIAQTQYNSAHLELSQCLLD